MDVIGEVEIIGTRERYLEERWKQGERRFGKDPGQEVGVAQGTQTLISKLIIHPESPTIRPLMRKTSKHARCEERPPTW